MITFQTLLREAGLAPKDVVVFRHRPPEPRLQQLLPSFVAERPELFRAYQSLQGAQAAAVLRRAGVLASFIGQERGQATFAGLWRIGASRSVPEATTLPYISDLVALGMSIAAPDQPADTFFDLDLTGNYSDWIGRLVVDWPARGINWKLRADRNEFSVRAIAEENRFVEPMPDWLHLSLSWAQLGYLPGSWRSKLSGWRGVYYIFDEVRRMGYVGSACGTENLLGRWSDYAATGHGGNEGLRGSRPDDLRFSILELTSPSLDLDAVVRIEDGWKRRLCTREHGLNRN